TQIEDLRACIRESWGFAYHFRERTRQQSEEAQRRHTHACRQAALTRQLCDWQPLAGSNAWKIRTGWVAPADLRGQNDAGYDRAHEWAEDQTLDHDVALKAAARTDLPVGDGARRILKAIAK